MQHEFVNTIPDRLQEGVLYISTIYATAVHRCACGCGREVVTPLSPTDWAMVFDGETISLAPSIGNWSFPCQSHYWIERSRVAWAPKWSRRQIEDGRSRDRMRKSALFDVVETKSAKERIAGRWSRFFNRFGRW